jgi:hypothetical protein
MNKLYTNGNYVIAEDSRGVHEYGKAKSVYSVVTNPDGYVIKEAIDTGELVIPTADIPTWFDETGLIPYTEASLVIFLRDNTASFSSGGVSTFEALTDTPSYVGNALKGLRINAGETALEAYVSTDLNQWLMSGVAFVDPTNGDNITATVGDGNLPYKTLAEAQNNSDYVIAMAGLYWLGTQGSNVIPILDGKHIHFMVGAITGSNSSIRDNGVSVNAVITGQLICGSNSFALSFTGAATSMHIEMEAMENTKQIVHADNGAEVHLIIKRIDCNNSTGSGYACRMWDHSRITIDVLEYCHTRHWLVGEGAGVGGPCYFTIRCPDLKIVAANTYGNQFKALINCQSYGHVIFTIEVDEFINEAAIQTTAFGILEGGLGIYTGGAGNFPNEFHFKGDYDTGKMYGWFDYSGVDQGLSNFKDGSLKCETVPFSSIAVNVGGLVNRVINVKNFYFEGGLTQDGFNQIGNGRIASFIDCRFKNTNVAGTRIFNHNNAFPVAGPPELYLYNCIGDMDNAGAGALWGGVVPPVILGTVNTYSSEPIGPSVVDAWLGYSQIIGFIIPKF